LPICSAEARQTPSGYEHPHYGLTAEKLDGGWCKDCTGIPGPCALDSFRKDSTGSNHPNGMRFCGEYNSKGVCPKPYRWANNCATLITVTVTQQRFFATVVATRDCFAGNRPPMWYHMPLILANIYPIGSTGQHKAHSPTPMGVTANMDKISALKVRKKLCVCVRVSVCVCVCVCGRWGLCMSCLTSTGTCNQAQLKIAKLKAAISAYKKNHGN